MENEILKGFLWKWFSFYKRKSLPNVEEQNEAYHLILKKIDYDKIVITDIDKFIERMIEETGFEGEDNFFYVGLKEMLIYLIKKDFLGGPKIDQNKD